MVAAFILSVLVGEDEDTEGGRWDSRGERGGCDFYSLPTVKKNDVHNSFLSPAVADGVFYA